jgi:hypothetical protein
MTQGFVSERKEIKMRKAISAIVLAGSLMFVTAAFADITFSWRFDESNRRWEQRSDSYSTRADLREAKRKLAYDLARGANYRVIARDRARIREIEESLREERSYRNQGWYWHDNGWHKGWNK